MQTFTRKACAPPLGKVFWNTCGAQALSVTYIDTPLLESPVTALDEIHKVRYRTAWEWEILQGRQLPTVYVYVTYIMDVSHPYPWQFSQPQFHKLFSLGWISLAELCTQCQTLLQWIVNYCFWKSLQCNVSEVDFGVTEYKNVLVQVWERQWDSSCCM